MQLAPTTEGTSNAIPLAGTWRAQPGATSAQLGSFPRRSWFHANVATALYNGMIAPLVPYAMRGGNLVPGRVQPSHVRCSTGGCSRP